jgi:hypothetical protein
MTHEEYQKDIKQGCKKFFERLENLKKWVISNEKWVMYKRRIFIC